MENKELYNFRVNDLKIINQQEDKSILNYTKKYQDQININKEIYKEELKLYKQILKDAKDLVYNLGIDNNSISYSIIISNLLWQGYLSVNKTFNFNSTDNEKFLDLAGLESFDVILGEGCCRHLTPFLDDILSELNISAKDIINYTVPIKPNRKAIIKIERKDDENYPYGTYYLYDEKEEEPPLGDHMSSLIIQNNNYYIYDVTNLLTFKVDNITKEKLTGTMYDGEGYIKLKAYSLMQKYNLNFNEIRTILSDIKKQDKSDFITKSEYETIVKYTNNICINSKDIFNSFHNKIKPDLKTIKEKVLSKKTL